MVDRDQAIEYALKEARDNDVKFIRLWFTDILGNLKGFAITVEEFETALTRGMGFDGSAIQGFARVEEKDLYALPDPNTFAILPWRPRENAVARLFCDLVTPDDKAFEGDPRFVLRRNIERATKMGYTYYVGPEIEYFYFKDDSAPDTVDTGGYFDQDTTDFATDLRRETVLMLEELSIPVEASHHEVAPSQHEIDLRYTDALSMADAVMTYKLVVKEIAQRHNCYATFMPKPLADVNGSGMHVNQSLFTGGRNAFYDAEDGDRLSDTAKHFVAGLLRHAREITLVTNQWGEFLQAARPQFRGSRPRHLGYRQPRRPGARAVLQVRQGGVPPRGIPRPGPGLQPVPGFQRHARRRTARNREQVRTSAARRRRRIRDYRGRKKPERHRIVAQQSAGSHTNHREERIGQKCPRRRGVRQLPGEQDD